MEIKMDEGTVYWLRHIEDRLRRWSKDIEDHTRSLRKANYHSDQPRVPAGQTTGGQWTSGGRSTETVILKPRANRKPNKVRPTLNAEELARFNQNAPANATEDDLRIDPNFGLPRWYVEGAVTSTLSPLDFIGGTNYWAFGAEEETVLLTARKLGQSVIEKPPFEKLTAHGAIRNLERVASDKEIDEAIKTAVKNGRISEKVGKYNTRQYHYKGDNGLTVIIESEGKNAGKIITVYGEKEMGKL